MSTSISIDYTPHPTLARFHSSKAAFRGIKGPFGSGKSFAMCMEIWKLILQQAPGPDGIRHARLGVTRNTFSELKTATLTTWLEVFPEEVFGPVKYDLPHTHRIKTIGPDGIPIDLEALFFPLDKPGDVKKLKGFNLTWVWMNEASEQPKEAFDILGGRINRYPTGRFGEATHPCLIMDYNPPPTDHWIYKLAEEGTPEGYEFFSQPPAAFPDPDGPIVSAEGTRYRLNPQAENLAFVAGKGTTRGSHYYTTYLQGKDDTFIRVFGMGEYGYIGDGRPVYTQYNDAVHFETQDLPVYRKLPLLLGFDFGLNVAVVMAQITPRGQLRLIDELYEEGMLLPTFLDDILVPHLAQNYPDMEIKGWGDPAGSARSSLAERNAYDYLWDKGMKQVRPAPIPKNEFLPRKGAVDEFLRKQLGGVPGLVVGPKAKMLHAGFLGRYKLARMQVPGEHSMYKDRPVKNAHSHIHDALQYLAVGLVGPRMQGSPELREIEAAAAMAGRHRVGDLAVGY